MPLYSFRFTRATSKSGFITTGMSLNAHVQSFFFFVIYKHGGRSGRGWILTVPFYNNVVYKMYSLQEKNMH